MSVTRSRHPHDLPTAMRGSRTRDYALLMPGACTVLATGAFLVTDGPYRWGDTFVVVGVVAVISGFSLGHGVLLPSNHALSAAAEDEIAAAPPGLATRRDKTSAAIYHRILAFGGVVSMLVVIAVVVMIVKP